MDMNEISASDVGSAAGKAARAVGSGIKDFAKGFMGSKDKPVNKNLRPIINLISKLSTEDTNELVKYVNSLPKQQPASKTSARSKTASTANKKTSSPQQTAAQATQGQQQAPNKQQPAARATQGQQQALNKQQPAAQNPKNAAAGDTYEKAKGNVRKAQSGQKPIPPKAAADIQGAISKLAKGDKESGVYAAQKIMNLAKAGVDVSKQQQAWIANSKAGERFLTQSIYFEISKMLRENNLSWVDLGIRVHLLEGTNKMFGLSYV